MMKKAIIEALKEFSRTHLVILLVFLALAAVYMNPVIGGKVLSQHDMTQFDGMKQELVKYHEETGKYSQWTNSIFSGMPGFHVGPTGKYNNLFARLAKVPRLFMGVRNPIGIMFVFMLCFYVLLKSMKLGNWVSALGAVAFAFSSYNLIILPAGHINKAYALAYMAPVIGGILMTYRGEYMKGGLLFLLGLGLQLYINHLQITYYLLILAIIIVATKGIYAIMEKQLKKFLTASGVLVAAAILALLPNFSSLWVNYEITKLSMRGKPELTLDKENQTSGLNRDYALSWSYGKAETFSLMIPYMTGGKTDALGNNEKAMEKVSPRFRETIASQNAYWGAKASTQGDYYSGAIVVFLFILGLLLIKGPMRWWVIISSALSIMLAWGNNFLPLSNFFLDHVPLYNKFRTVEMTMIIVCFNIPLVAFLVMDRLIKEPELLKEKRKELLIAFGLTGGLSLLFALVPGIFSYFSEREQQMFAQQLAGADPQYAAQFRSFMDELEAARIYIFRHDAIRSFIFIALAFLLIWYYAAKKLKLNWLLAGMALLVIADLWMVDQRYLNKDNFITKKQQENVEVASKADQSILQDPDMHYRVVNLTVSPWQDGTTSFHHKSIGGYHAVKMRRYQDLIERYLSPGLQNVIQALNSRPTPEIIDSVLSEQQVLNMINTKYFILNPASPALQNTAAMGHGWIAPNVTLVDNPDQEYIGLGSADLRTTALVDRRFEALIDPQLQRSGASGAVELIDYKPNHMTYRVETDRKALAVFSEVYYGDSWQAYIDGQEVDHLRANYILRALPVEAGAHTVEFHFRFTPFEVGTKISLAGSILVLLLLLGMAGRSIATSRPE